MHSILWPAGLAMAFVFLLGWRHNRRIRRKPIADRIGRLP